MSTHTTTHAPTNDGGGHGGHHAEVDHVPHVLPILTYFKTWGALMVLTVITVGASYVNLGPLNIILALLIATMKASVVALIFMHLYYDHKFHIVIFASSVVFLAIFILITMTDTDGRGLADPIEKQHPADMKDPFALTPKNQNAMTREDRAFKDKVEARVKSEGLPVGVPMVAPTPAPTPAPGGTAPAPAPTPAPSPAPAPH